MKKNIELMAPAGSFESLHAALKSGADSIYCGVGMLNMRARASSNFSFEDLEEIVRICDDNGVKVYVTLNIVMYDSDLSVMREVCDAAKRCGVEAIIAGDIAVLEYARSIGQAVHISTQCNISNTEAVRFYSKYSDVMVLARELSLEQIREICSAIDREDIKGPSGDRVRVEIFAHGALCVAIAGKCHMSLVQHNMSANRGECLQICRRKYRISECDTGEEFIIDNQYIMSPKDLCTVGFIDKIIEAGVSVLKIEGRGRAPEYVSTVVEVYREAIESALAGEYSDSKIQGWITRLEAVYNRGFWHGGYYLGSKLGEWTGTYGSKATKKKMYLGKVTNYFSRLGVMEFKLENDKLENGDDVIITGATTGVIKMCVASLRSDKTEGEAYRGDVATMYVPEKVRKNDKVFIVVDRVKI